MQKGVKYEADYCGECGQTKTYVLSIDRGAVDTLKAISVAIRKKGINEIHPRKEMELSVRKLSYRDMVTEGHLTSNQVGNLSRLRFHGLIFSLAGRSGFYGLSQKGSQFLRGGDIPHLAVISKQTGHQIGYYLENEQRVTIADFKPDTEYWEGITYQVEDGKVSQEFSRTV